jgi:hypothetical protein
MCSVVRRQSPITPGCDSTTAPARRSLVTAPREAQRSRPDLLPDPQAGRDAPQGRQPGTARRVAGRRELRDDDRQEDDAPPRPSRDLRHLLPGRARPGGQRRGAPPGRRRPRVPLHRPLHTGGGHPRGVRAAEGRGATGPDPPEHRPGPPGRGGQDGRADRPECRRGAHGRHPFRSGEPPGAELPPGLRRRPGPRLADRPGRTLAAGGGNWPEADPVGRERDQIVRPAAALPGAQTAGVRTGRRGGVRLCSGRRTRRGTRG